MPFRFPFGNPYYYSNSSYKHPHRPSPSSKNISSYNNTNNFKYNNYKEEKK